MKRCNRATPCEWAKLSHSLQGYENYKRQKPRDNANPIDEELGKPNAERFYDNSTSMVGRQNLANRLDFFKEFPRPWNMDKFDTEIRIFLK